MRRIILGATSGTAALQEIQLKLGELQETFGTAVATQFATAVGTSGSSLLGAAEKHQHPVAVATAGMIQPISLATSTAGIQPYFPRADHIHFFNFGAQYGPFACNVSMATSTAGVDTTVSRVDHVHYLIPGATASIEAVGAANDGGVSVRPARADHVHQEGVGLTGNVNYAATATLLAVAGVADAGTHTTVARGDHVHNTPFAATATMCNVAWSAAEAGTATTVARGDHIHKLNVGARIMTARGTSQTFTNNHSGPLYIGISLSLSAPGVEGAHLQIGGTDVAHAEGAANIHFFIMGIANPGEEYLLTATGGAHIDHWMEYGF